LLPVLLLLLVSLVHAAEPPRAARSVHLGYSGPDAGAFYLDMVVEQSVPGSYFMAAGWNTGYFGVQQLDNPTNKVVIFSVWDPSKGDDPNATRPEDRVEVLFQGDGVAIKRFGGEGTGGQCLAPFAWKIGQTNRFLVRAEPSGDKTSYTAWILKPESQSWWKLATFRTRTGGQWLQGLYSFVEDFRRDTASAGETRGARFGNVWIKPSDSIWQNLTQARFTASNADWESKDNIDARVDGNWFALATGGDIRSSTPLKSLLAVPPATAVPVDLPSEVSPPPHPQLVPGADGIITLHSSNAVVHGTMLRYEPQTNKICLGYWTKAGDWAEWQFTIQHPGTFEVEVWQGCGKGQGGSDVLVEVNHAKLPFVVEDTGHFQNFVPRRIGRVEVARPGVYSLAIKPQRKQAAAVMDIRQVRLVPVTTAQPTAPAARSFLNARRAVFLGDSITYAGEWIEFVEAWVRLNHPAATVELLDLGLPSETVSGLSEPGHAGGAFPRPDLHERLGRVLDQLKPDIVVACYGMNDGIYLPFDEARFRQFQDGIVRLRERCAAAGAHVVHVTPPPFDEVRGGHPGYSHTLDRYSQWLLEQPWEVVDVHGPMNRFLADHRRTDPEFRLADDGVHVNTQGHWLIAREVLRHWGAPDSITASGTPAQWLESQPRGEEVLKLVQQRQRLLKDAWLTEVGHSRPGLNRGKPLADANQESAAIEARIKDMTGSSIRSARTIHPP